MGWGTGYWRGRDVMRQLDSLGTEGAPAGVTRGGRRWRQYFLVSVLEVEDEGRWAAGPVL
jgi:hypothetical protein